MKENNVLKGLKNWWKASLLRKIWQGLVLVLIAAVVATIINWVLEQDFVKSLGTTITTNLSDLRKQFSRAPKANE